MANESISEELGRLADLRDRGVLTQAEFDAQKQKLLAALSDTSETGPSGSSFRATARFSDANASSDTGKNAGVVPPKKRSTLKVGCLVVLGIFVFLFIMGLIVGPQKKGAEADSNSASADAGPVAPAAPEARKVTAAQVARAYDANEAAAQQEFGNQPLLVSGKIAGVSLDFKDEPFLQLATGNFVPANAQLTDASKPKASTLRKGQSVVLLCQNVTEVISIPQFDRCEIQ